MSIEIHAGDCRDVLATLPESSVQCCVTSPPYYGLRDYGVAGQIGLEPTPDEYVAEMVSVFRAVRRVLREDGSVWLNLGDSYANGRRASRAPDAKSIGREMSVRPFDGAKPKDLLGIPWRVAFALQADGWYLRSAIVWHKPNPMPESVTDRPTSSYEMVFLLTKAERYFYDAEAVREPAGDNSHGSPNINPGWKQEATGNNQGGSLGRWTAEDKAKGRNLRNVWTIATQPYSGAHFAVMPPELAERCIKAGTSEKGCCPTCRAPWDSVVERETRPNWQGGADQKHDGTHYRPNPGGGVGNDRRMSSFVGWSPSCSCPPHDPVPCLVLDPFGGAGTTGLVADRLNRNAVLIELNPEYAGLSRDRVKADAGMFADVA